MAQSAKPVKLLVSGPPKGHFKPLLERLAKLNASAHGPFDACFVLGDFFEGGHAASPDLLGAPAALRKSTRSCLLTPAPSTACR